MAETAPDIKALFFSPRCLWLLPNDLVRAQILDQFLNDKGQASNGAWRRRTALGPEIVAREGAALEVQVFPRGRYPRLETFSSLERALARELDPPEMDDLGRRLILYDLARTLAEHLWPDLDRPADGSAPALAPDLFTDFCTDFCTDVRSDQSEAERRLTLRGADLKALADDLGDGFDRLKLAGLGWDQVAKLPPAGLGALLADLGRRHDRLLAGLGRKDRFARRRQVLEELKAGRKFQALAEVEEIVCRWSQRLSPFETDFILALARGRQLRLTLKVPAWVRDENIDHGSGFDLLRAIRRIEKSQEPTLWLDFSEYQTPDAAHVSPLSGQSSPCEHQLSSDRLPPPALAYAADVLLAPAAYRRPDPPDPTDCLRLIRAAGAYQEVEEAARILKERLLAGCRAEDLALVVPNPDRYGQLLDDVSRRFGLAFHSRRGDSLAETGPARAIIDLLALWSSNWERSRFLEFIRNPYFQLNLDPAACHRLALSAGVTDSRAGGGFEENLGKIKVQEGQTARNLLDLLGRLKTSGRRLNESRTWAEFLLRIKKLLNDLGWPGDLSQAPLAPLNVRAADLAAAQACASELDRLGEAFEQSPRPPAVGLAEFRLWLEDAFGEARLTWDRNPEGRIRVLNYYDLHGGFFDEIFFLGLGERIYPQTAPESRWWPEELVRGAAELLGRPLWSDAADRYRQEELLFAAALGQARKRVWLFYPGGEESGRLVAPSPLLAALTELWTDEEGQSRLALETAAGGLSPPLSRAAGPDELWVALAALPPEKWPRGWPESREIAKVMTSLRRRWERWQAQKNEARLSPALMRLWLERRPNHAGRPLLSPTFLAGFEDCPLAFWGREILGLSAEGEPVEEWPRTSEGIVVHRTLERFFQARLGPARGRPGPPWPGRAEVESCRAELLDILNQEIEQCARRDPLGRKPLWELRRSRLPDLLSGWLRREMSGTAEPIQPLSLEWSFGPRPDHDAEPWPFDPGDGEYIYFQGRADRLDQTGQGLSLRDYKLRDSEAYHLRRRDGQIQVSTRVWPILTYALAAADHLGQRVEAGYDIIEGAGASGRLQVMATDQPEMSRAAQGAEAEAYNFPRQLAQAWRRMRDGRFPPLGEPEGACLWCPLTLLCPRRDPQSGPSVKHE